LGKILNDLTIDVHLTNVAVQKTAPDYDPDKGSKWSIRQLRQYLSARHGLDAVSYNIYWTAFTITPFIALKVNRCFRQMDEIFIKSLQSVQKIMINDKHCFELYGYDILLDSGLKP
jgi:tubulin polyglutamylase TTLL9